ncbi:UNVERIFIED_CONTAM: hypothetical protein PYX00_008235 [Menopon gallinae]|uniref:Uncharacterized protein n=1 Tax=Menopon gallinae TaxID=328185 RepID=A0AAW2HN80_9NEOP
MNNRKMRFLFFLCIVAKVVSINENCMKPYISGQSIPDCSWVEALNTMTYHRSMMNEYLCRNYLANEIMDTVRNRTIDKRLGRPAMNVRLARDSMMEDSGSEKYKDWLSRSTTLQDIYRHYEGMPEGDSLQGSQTAPIGDGDVTGYAFLGEKSVGHGLGDFGPSYHHGYHHFEHFEDEYEHEEKGLKLKEIFDLALTAIAFLAFGAFVTETMIYGFGAQNQEAQMMIMSPVAGGNGIAFKSNVEGPTLPNTNARSIPSRDVSNDVLNEISKQVLTSIEALSVFDRDGGECLRRVLCENNKYARTLSGGQKIWLPLWSFGASWIAGKFAKPDNNVLLENLKAALFGFGDANCEKLYGKCGGKLKRRRK